MAVNSYAADNGETLWRVYVNVRSKTSSAIRAQRKLGGFKTQREAEREEIKLIRECEREILEKEAQGSEWGSVVEAFEKYLMSPQAKVLQDTTRWDYVAAIRKHTTHWWKRSAASITKIDLRELFTQLHAEGFSVSHQLKMKVVIGRVFTYGIEYGLIHGILQSPTIGIQLGRDEEKKPEILTITEIRKLLERSAQAQHPGIPMGAGTADGDAIRRAVTRFFGLTLIGKTTPSR